MFEAIGAYDALVAVVGGDSIFRPFDELTDDDYRYGFERKFLGQVRLIKIGKKFAREKGSFTLSSGFLSHYPNPFSAATGPLNAAVDSFVRGTAPLLSKGLRLNVVSPAPVVEPTQVARGRITAMQATAAYVESVTSTYTGKIFRVWGGLENEPLPG